MHSPLDSLRKRLYTMRLDSDRCAETWRGRYWIDDGDTRSIACRRCRKFSAAGPRCTVPFGSPLRKCVAAAQEAHLHSLHGKHLLEIGYGRHSIPRRLVTSAGGTWTGIDPFSPSKRKAAFGRGGLGHVSDIPFPDASFDIVVGIQTLEHWSDPLPDARFEIGYQKGLDEVFRVLKPGGSIYFDAPIHLHGHEMFIVGDIERIRGLFDPRRWRDVVIEKWRQDYEPLEAYPTPATDRSWWADRLQSYSEQRLQTVLSDPSVWLLTVSASTKANA